jgi:hypothetical protein
MGISDEILAADVALHLWYSAFIPAEYNARIILAVQAVVSSIKVKSSDMNLDWGSEEAVRIVANFAEETSMQFMSYVQPDKSVDPGKAAAELLAVMSVIYATGCLCHHIEYKASER